MRRFVIGLSAAAVSLLGGAFASTSVVEATPAEGQAVVGAWRLTVDEFPDDPPSLLVFHADGTFQESDPDGSTGIGAWQSTGPTSFNLTYVSMSANGDGTFSPILTIRAAGEVAADGQTFTAQYTIEFTAEGFPAGQYGPGNVTATRINVEPMGTPVGSLDDLFAQFEEGPAGSEPAGSAPAGSEPAGSEPTGSEPAGSEPAGSEPTGTEPTGTEPTGTEPTGTEPTGTEPTGTEPTGSEPTGTEPTGTEPAPATTSA